MAKLYFYNAAMIALLGGACTNTPPRPTAEDAATILSQAVDIGTRTRAPSPELCLVDRLKRAGADDGRQAPSVGRLSSKWAPKFARVSTNFGCANTLIFSEPLFDEMDFEGQRVEAAQVFISDMCGPICGAEFVIAFSRIDGKWKPLNDVPTSTGTRY